MIQGDLISLLEVIDFTQNPPVLIPNHSVEKLRIVIEDINEQLRSRNENATAITLPNTLTAASIADICRQAYIAVLQNWIDIKQDKIDNEAFDDQENGEDFVDEQLLKYDVIAALQDAIDSIRRMDVNELLKLSKVEEFLLLLKEHCTGHKDKDFKRDDEDAGGGDGNACSNSRSNTKASSGNAASCGRIDREKHINDDAGSVRGACGSKGQTSGGRS